MTPWLLLSIILGFSHGLRSKNSWVLTPNVFRCNETETIVVHSFDSSGNCVNLQLKSEKDGKVINETGKELHLKKQKKFKLGVFNDHCLLDHVYLDITTYEPERKTGEAITNDCSNNVLGNISKKIQIQKNAGYIFIQTDLPIYHPSETVNIRIFRLNENMYPVNTSVVMVIKDPSSSVVKNQPFYDEPDIVSTSFELDNRAQTGIWTISVKYAGIKASKETNIRFLVHEYVMPKFEIDIDVQPKLISKSTEFINISITAMYFYNKTVDGKVYLEYGNNGDNITGKLTNGQYFKQVEIKGERCGSFSVSAKVIEENTRMTEYKTESIANFINSDSIPKEKNDLERSPKSNEMYLTKSDDKKEYMQGDRIEVIAENCNRVYYCIIGRGRIVSCNKEDRQSKTIPVKIMFQLTEEMIPLAKLITYCIEQERINSTATTLSFKAHEICSGKESLVMHIPQKKDYYAPQDNITIHIKGYRGQTIALSMVDDAVYVISNRYRLTPDFVRKKMMSHTLESFANLNDSSKSWFPHTRYNIHPILHEKKAVLVSLEGVPITKQRDLEEHKDILEDVSLLPRAMYQISNAGPKVFKYDYFPASALFKTYSLSNTDELTVNITLPDSLTRWYIQAISLSKTSPFCVHKPIPIITFKYIVPQLHFPQYVEKYGFFEIKVILYNYETREVRVNITLSKTKHICSKGSGIHVTVAPSDSTVTKFLAYAMHTGDVPVSVAIKYYDDTDGDRKEIIEKIISIREHQVYKPRILTFYLEKTVNFEDSAVSGMTCNKQTVLGDIVKTTLQEPEKLMRTSHGSGNQNIIYMAMTVYVLKYIQNTKQMSHEIDTNGKKFIRLAMEKQKFFQKNDGSYSSYVDSKSSIWLTAFVLKVFCQAWEFERIDKGLTREALFWLLKQQEADGSFEDTSYANTDIMGGRSTLELTAFVFISMMECRQIHAREIGKNERRMLLSMEYLEKNLDTITNGLTLAITTYALTLAMSDKGLYAWEKMTVHPWLEKNSFEGPPPSDSVLIASYALLTQLQYDDITTASPIFNWLIKQKNNNGMFSSTQNTVIALQALAEYSIKWNAPDLNLKLIRPNETSNVPPNTINKIAFLKKTTSSLGSTDNQIRISSLGARSTYVQVLTDFNIFNTKEKNCHFNISVPKLDKIGKKSIGLHFLNISFQYTGKSSMESPVLELDLITGFYMKNHMIKEIEHLSFIKRIEEYGDSILTFFLRKLEPGDKVTLNLTLERDPSQIHLTPSTIRIYNYEKPDESCVKMYPSTKHFDLFCHSNKCLCPGGCVKEQDTLDDMRRIFCKKIKNCAMIVNITGERTNKSRKIYSAKIIKHLMKNQGKKEYADIILESDCTTSNLQRGKNLIVTDKFLKTNTKRDKYWIDSHGFVISYNTKRLERDRVDFIREVKTLQYQGCYKRF